MWGVWVTRVWIWSELSVYFEEVVGVFLHFEVANSGGGCHGEMKKSGYAEFECGKLKCRVVYIRKRRWLRFFWSVGGISGDLFSMVMVCVQRGKI